MDLEKQKRNQVIRVVITEILMVLAIIPIVILLTLMAMGYHLGEDMTLEQSGLVQVISVPNGATVKVDGEEKFKTDASRMLAGGEHALEITKDGYDSWSKKIDVMPGFLLRIRYARLFKTARETETVSALDGLRVMSVAPSRTRLIYQLNANPKLRLMNIRNDEVKDTELDLTSVLRVENDAMLGRIGQIKWSWNSDAVLLQVIYDDATEWVLVDMRDDVPNRNLSKDFGLAITDVQFAGSSTERMYILENSNLREINLSSNGVSKVLLGGVEEFYAEQANVGYISKQGEQRVVGIYRNGDATGVVVTEIPENLSAHVAISEYYGEKYLSYTIGNKLKVSAADALPTNNNELKRMRSVVETELGFNPTSAITVNRTGEAILLRGEQEIGAVDLETNKYQKYPAVGAGLKFIDDYLLYGVSDGALTVWDFDGGNQRVLAREVLDFPAVISANNHWLYYMTQKDEKPTLVRERL